MDSSSHILTSVVVTESSDNANEGYIMKSAIVFPLVLELTGTVCMVGHCRHSVVS